MLKIGLTGGIGSGKSTVARIFEVLEFLFIMLMKRQKINE